MIPEGAVDAAVSAIAAAHDRFFREKEGGLDWVIRAAHKADAERAVWTLVEMGWRPGGEAS